MHVYPISVSGSYIWLSDGITAEAAESEIWNLVSVAALEPQACSHTLTLLACRRGLGVNSLPTSTGCVVQEPGTSVGRVQPSLPTKKINEYL